MRRRILINTSTVVGGGAMQVAYNFISLCNKLENEYDFWFITNLNVNSEITTDSTKTLVVNISPAKYYAFQVRKEIKEFADRVNADIIYSVGSPSYVRFNQLEVQRLTNPWIINQLNVSAYQVYSIPNRLFIRFKVLIQRYYLQHIKYFITQTDDAKDKISQNLGKELENIFVIGNTVSMNFIELNKQVSKSPLSSETWQILVLAAPYPHKNINICIEIAKYFKSIGKNDFKFVLTIPKEQYNKSSLRKNIKKFGVEEFFINQGKVPIHEIPKLFASCHIVFLPTLLEVFSATLIEAMLFKVPIITTKFSFNEKITKGAALYINNPFDYYEAANLILLLRNDTVLYKNLIEHAQNSLEPFLLSKDIYRSHISVLDRIIENHPRI